MNNLSFGRHVEFIYVADSLPHVEINFGLGVDVTGATDHLIAKMSLGYRFDF